MKINSYQMVIIEAEVGLFSEVSDGNFLKFNVRPIY
jgi:hypothetical protein